MSKHRAPRELQRYAWHQIRQHLNYLHATFRYWLHEQKRELQDILAELQERKHVQ